MKKTLLTTTLLAGLLAAGCEPDPELQDPPAPPAPGLENAAVTQPSVVAVPDTATLPEAP